MHLHGIALILTVDITTVVFIHGSNARQPDTVSAGPAQKTRHLRDDAWAPRADRRYHGALWHHGKEQEGREDG
jgi:hypothetical protein